MRTGWSIPLILAACLATMPAAAQDWLELDTERFTVVSQLNERDTRRWAREFNQFVQALSQLMPQNEALLPPLTAVLFKRDGGFSPYRIRTESGVVGGNAGVFINYSTWSLIGMPGARGSSTDYSTIYHEAVHWYMSSDPGNAPLWFREGIAEVFSTFEIERGSAVWGQTIPNSMSMLRANGFKPMREFIEVTQDEALHVNASYYSQAWLFVHYLLFNQLSEGKELLSPLLKNLETMEPAEAFLAAFDMEFEEMDSLLRDYARQNQFIVARSPVVESDDSDFAVRPAPEELVQLSLARLAFGTGNDEVLADHLNLLNEVAPESAEAYDLIAADLLRDREGGSDNADVMAALDRAIAFGSRDARTYELAARFRIGSLRNNTPLFSEAGFDSADARRIANYLVSSANLRPVNLTVYRALADVLYSVDEVHDYDTEALELGAAVYPNEGIVLIGQAAIALGIGDSETAAELIQKAMTDTYRLEPGETSAAASLLSRLNR